MTIPNKNSRTITVDNVQDRYVIKISEYVGRKIIIELDGIKSQCLVGYLDDWKNYREVTPSTIKSIIIKSIAKGWNPEAQNSGFYYIKQLDDLLLD